MKKYMLITVSVLALVSCGEHLKDVQAPEAKLPMLITAVDLVEVSAGRVTSGPVISGSLQAKKQADLRVEVSVIVLQVIKDNGDSVKKGDLLVRLDDTTFRQALSSAQEAERVAQQSFDQAERQFNRLQALSHTGAVSTQVKEDADLRRSTAQSELAAARTRLVHETQQFTRTEVRAPFAGVVSGREVSNGDTVQIGKALLKVIDPTSIYFSGFVASDEMPSLKIGQVVKFNISGYRNHVFEGNIVRIDPVADANTGQIGVEVAINDNKTLTVGLYADGRVQTNVTHALTLPEGCLVHQGDHTYVWRVKAGVLNKIEVNLGARDVQSGDYTINSGLVDGDNIIRHPRGALVDGASVKIEKTVARNAKKEN